MMKLRRSGSETTEAVRARLKLQQAQALSDLSELERQVEDEEMTPGTAERLRNTYRSELEEVTAALAALPDVQAPEEPGEDGATSEDGDGSEREDGAEVGVDEAGVVAGSDVDGATDIDTESEGGNKTRTKWVMVGAGALLVAITGGIIVLGGGFGLIGNEEPTAAVIVIPGGELDIANTSTEALEEALATFPSNFMIRLTLADRHLEEGKDEEALEHYLAVADDLNAGMDVRSRALARIGYLSYTGGYFEPARRALEESLEFDDTNTEAKLYLGYILLTEFDETQLAVVYLSEVAADSTITDTIRADVLALLEDAKNG